MLITLDLKQHFGNLSRHSAILNITLNEITHKSVQKVAKALSQDLDTLPHPFKLQSLATPSTPEQETLKAYLTTALAIINTKKHRNLIGAGKIDALTSQLKAIGVILGNPALASKDLNATIIPFTQQPIEKTPSNPVLPINTLLASSVDSINNFFCRPTHLSVSSLNNDEENSNTDSDDCYFDDLESEAVNAIELFIPTSANQHQNYNGFDAYESLSTVSTLTSDSFLVQEPPKKSNKRTFSEAFVESEIENETHTASIPASIATQPPAPPTQSFSDKEVNIPTPFPLHQQIAKKNQFFYLPTVHFAVKIIGATEDSKAYIK
jgi:hypothetical protein